MALKSTGFDGLPPASADAGALPAQSLRVEHVHGYNTSTVAYASHEGVVFAAAAVGLVHRNGRQEAIFGGHTDDVSCLAVDEAGEMVATGRRPPPPPPPPVLGMPFSHTCRDLSLSMPPSSHSLAMCMRHAGILRES